jgi:monovalent cation:H+ antiporter-2, CPA2 family
MHSLDLIFTLTGGLGAVLVLGYFTQRVGLSPIVGYLLAGTLVGPYTPDTWPTWGSRSNLPRLA